MFRILWIFQFLFFFFRKSAKITFILYRFSVKIIIIKMSISHICTIVPENRRKNIGKHTRKNPNNENFDKLVLLEFFQLNLHVHIFIYANADALSFCILY